MAIIKKTALVTKLAKSNDKLMRKFEKEINEELKVQFSQGGDSTASIPIPSELPDEMLSAVIDRIRKAGYTVEGDHDRIDSYMNGWLYIS